MADVATPIELPDHDGHKPIPLVKICVEILCIGWRSRGLASSGGTVHSQDGDPATMSIGEVARRTGVTVPTLRAWERRYGLLVPVRTAGGHRRYRDEDVQRVLAVLELTGQGWAVGAAARRVADRKSPSSPARPPVDELRDRLWSALDQALRELPPGTEAAAPPGEPPTTGQAEASAGALDAQGTSGSSVRAAGGCPPPAAKADSWALPIHLSLGEGEPILPVAEPLSLARMQLEQVLPGLVEDARRAVQLLRRSEGLDG